MATASRRRPPSTSCSRLLGEGLEHRGKPPAPGTHRVHHVEQACVHGLALVGVAWVVTQGMRLVAGLGQFDLFLPFAGAGAGFLGQRIPAMRTAYAGGVVLGLTICHGNRRAAGMTLVIIARAQVMPHGDPIVEDEGGSAPPRLF